METYDTDKKSENEQIIAEVKTEAPATMFTAWKKFACFKGRASRREYWLFKISVAIVTYPLLFLIDFVPEIFGAVLSVALLLFYGAGILPFLGVTIRRLHDTGRNWLSLLNYITIVIVGMALSLTALSGDMRIYFIIAGSVLSFCGLISFITVMSRASEPCENRYGANPNQDNHDGIAPVVFGILILYILPLLIRVAVYIYMLCIL